MVLLAALAALTVHCMANATDAETKSDVETVQTVEDASLEVFDAEDDENSVDDDESDRLRV